MHLIKIMLPLLSASLLMGASAKTIYHKKCASCHGKKAEKKALGQSNIIKGMPVDKFITLTKAYATGEKKAMPLSKMIKKQFIKKYDDKEIKAVAEYVNKL